MAAKKAAPEAESEAPAQKRSKKKLIIMLVALLLLLGGGGYMAWYMFMAPSESSLLGLFGGGSAKETSAEALKSSASDIKEIRGQVVTLAPFLVNLADPLGRRYIKLSMDVEVRESSDVATLNAGMPRVRDSILMILSSKTFEDISTTEGKILLKSDIINRINQILGGPRVIQVYFTDLVIQ